MKLKVVLEMFVTLISVFLTIFISTIYTSFAASYIIGFVTPILISVIDNIDFSKAKKENKIGEK